jgi:erythrin-vacuolar iron transport family protein
MIDDSTTPQEAVRLAIEREKTAYDFYNKAAKIVKYPGTKQMFEFLAQEETKHLKILQAELDKDYMQEM